MAGWMTYSVVVTALLGAAAWSVERAVAPRGVPSRWLWIGAGTASIALIGRAGIFPSSVRPLPSGPSAAPATRTSPGLFELDFSSVSGGLALPNLDLLLRWGWLLLSVATVTALVAALIGLHRRRSTWRPELLDGRPVLVSRSFGPAVLGLFRPSIVVPGWTRRLPARERELMLRHEEEHWRARDVHLVAAGLALIAALPWNAALWWQLRRLRMAIELDCDRRVLGRSDDRRPYARLLLEMGSRAATPTLNVLALARPTPFLERRIRAMTDSPKPRLVGAVTMALTGAFLGVAACEVDRPATTAPGTDPAGGGASATASPWEVDVRAGPGFVTGVVRDRETGDGLADVTAYIAELDMGAVTTTEGRFIIINVPAGSHALTLRDGDVEHVYPDIEVSPREQTTLEQTPSVEGDEAPLEGAAGAPETLERLGAEGERTSSSTAETGSVTGRVFLPDGSPAPNALAVFGELELGAVSTRDGRYLILDVPAGTHTIRFDLDGLESQEVTVEVEGGTANLVDPVTLRKN